MNKRLIINADDYGVCRSVNIAIEELITAGKLRNVSLLGNSWCYRDAADFLLDHPECSVGVHLNVVEGIPLSPTGKVSKLMGDHGQFVNLGQLLRRWLGSPVSVSKAVEGEFRAQIELLLADGLEITHADSHQHIHAFPPFWKILTRLCKEYGIGALRLPRERNKIGHRRLASIALDSAATVSKALCSNLELRVNDHFLGFKRAGGYGEDELLSDVFHLRDGVTEIACHPSLEAGIPYSNYRGHLDYQALSGSRLWNQIESSGIELITWKDLGLATCPQFSK